MKIVLFARILGSTRLCKISQESGLLSNFGSLPKIRNARFGRSHPLGVNCVGTPQWPTLGMVEALVYGWKVVETRVATFSGCAVITYWLPHTPVQIFSHLLLVHKTFWCSLSSLSIQTGVLAVTFHITLICTQK